MPKWYAKSPTAQDAFRHISCYHALPDALGWPGDGYCMQVFFAQEKVVWPNPNLPDCLLKSCEVNYCHYSNRTVELHNFKICFHKIRFLNKFQELSFFPLDWINCCNGSTFSRKNTHHPWRFLQYLLLQLLAVTKAFPEVCKCRIGREH